MEKLKRLFSTLTFVLMAICAMTFCACGDDDDDKMSSSPLIGTWTMQIQWAGTDGTRDQSYSFYANGTGTIKSWDWLNQKYTYQNFKWSATEDVISFDMEELPDGGAVSGIKYYIVTPTSLTLYYSDGDLEGNFIKK